MFPTMPMLAVRDAMMGAVRIPQSRLASDGLPPDRFHAKALRKVAYHVPLSRTA